MAKHWTWVGTDLQATDEEWKRRLAAWRAAGISAILPEIFNNHSAAYGSGHLPVAAPWLERLLPIAAAEGVEVHAWMHTMTLNVPEYIARHPEYYSVNRRAESTADKPPYVGYYRFLCPSRPEVHELLQQRVSELAAYGELSGIHLDYIRHPDVILAESLQPRYNLVQDREYPEFDYCYCEVCRAGFRARSGVDPQGLDDPSASAAWRQYRCDLITAIVNDKLVPIGRAAGKAMTAATFPNWQHVRQEWAAWDLDGVLPMLYHSFYNAGIDWIGAEVRRGIARLRRPLPLYSGLFVPALTPAELPRAVEVSMAAGAAGICLFAAGSLSAEHWQAFSRALGQA
ncbi:MAG: hypothetical protein ABIL09_18900 [Gemmatimonadota bacterium]